MMEARCYSCSLRKNSRTSQGQAASRQLYLVASKNKTLGLGLLPPLQSSMNAASIQDRTRDAAHARSFQESPITRLPDEILNEILCIGIEDDQRNWWNQEYYITAITLSRVCKLFHRIVQPLLFRNIQLSSPHEIAPACRLVKSLYRTMKSNPALGTCCKSASFHISTFTYPTFEDYAVGDELLSLCPNITSFGLHGGYGHSETWPFLGRIMQHMPNIKILTLSREDFDLHLAPVCEIIQTLNLQRLIINGISARKDSRAIRTSTSKDRERTLAISELIISDFGDTPEALQSLLNLPKALQHFEFGKVHSTPSTWWNLGHFQWLLHGHRESLRSIEIGALGREMMNINLLDFTKLETLNLSRWVFDFTPEIACATLLAPKLRTFIWDFTIEDQHSESWTSFGQEQRDWITTFAKLAVAQKSALRQIKIVFNPDEGSGPRTRDQLKDHPWPWDFMDQARDAMYPDVKLSYNNLWDRQHFIDRIEALEAEEHRRRDGNQYLTSIRRKVGAQDVSWLSRSWV